MVTHARRAGLNRLATLAVVGSLAAVGLVTSGCTKVPLVAPTGTAITLIPETTTVSLNSQVQIIATAIEQGVATTPTTTTTATTTTVTSTRGAGTAVQNGTVISFTTTIGTIQPQEARTHNGQVTVTLTTGSQSGTATITAYSGGASATLTLKVGTAAVGRVQVSASPSSLGPAGGTTQLTAQVTDDGGSPLGGVPVTFSTDVGTLSPATATTDASGTATTSLTTTGSSTVVAQAGATKSDPLKVNVATKGLAGFTASPTATSVGTPVTFTVTPAATGTNLQNVTVNFGDGASAGLGGISSAQSVPHVYSAPGQYTATATSQDANGSQTLSTTVIIGSLPVTLSANPSPGVPDSPITFTVQGVGTAQIDHYQWTFDDGFPTTPSTGPSFVRTYNSRGTKTVRVDVIALDGRTIGSATTQLTIQ